jgi:uncharacterized protein
MSGLPSPFTDDEFEELAVWLERRRAGITDIVELEGFLTAIVIGPNALSPNAWLPKVWGGKAPKFKDLGELNHFIGLVMGLHNDLALIFDQAPEQFRPTFYESKVQGRRIQIVDEWCGGFLNRPPRTGFSASRHDDRRLDRNYVNLEALYAALAK